MSGMEACESYKKLVGTEKVEAIEMVHDAFLMCAGWARREVIAIDKVRKTVRFRLYDNFECELGRGSNRCYSQLL